jgi:hypothetical protein
MVLSMNARETLRQRPDIPDDEVDDIVALASRLKDEDPASAQGATEEEVAQVAAELDIEPEYVEAALNQWRADKEAAQAEAKAAKEARAEAKLASAKRTKAIILTTVASAIILAMLSGGLATLGAARVNAALHKVVTTQSQLSVVLDRQATIAPQLVALGGGNPDAIATLATEVGSAKDMELRLEKSKALGIEMAKALAAPPGSMSDADAQIRLNLQHEITGTQNRVTTEARRYREAQAIHREAASGLTGRLATGYGLAKPPE